MENKGFDFTESQKDSILNTAIETAGEILITAASLINAENFIHGDLVFPNGTTWTLKFEKKKS